MSKTNTLTLSNVNPRQPVLNNPLSNQQLQPVAVIPAVVYTFTGLQFTKNQMVDYGKKCNSITAINKGTRKAFFNGIPLEPPPAVGLSGESVAIGGNAGEILTGNVEVQIDVADNAPLIVVIIKNYL